MSEDNLPILCIKMFGPFDVYRNTQDGKVPLEGLREHEKARMLLALLTLNHEVLLTKEDILTTLWGFGHTMDTLNKCISSLREALGEDNLGDTGDQSRIGIFKVGMRMALGKIRCDNAKMPQGKTSQLLVDLPEVDVDLFALKTARELFTHSLKHYRSDMDKIKESFRRLCSAVDRCEGPLLQGWTQTYKDSKIKELDQTSGKPLQEDVSDEMTWIEKARLQHSQLANDAASDIVRFAIQYKHYAVAERYIRYLWRNNDVAEDLSKHLLKAYIAAEAYPTAKQFCESYKDYLRGRSVKMPREITQIYNEIPSSKEDFVPPVETQELLVEAPGGALHVNSGFYVKRMQDEAFHTALKRGDATILIYGPRQVGKSSLLVRGVEHARQEGMQTVVVDFQAIDSESLGTAAGLCLAIMRRFQDQLDLNTLPHDYWNESMTPNENLERYIENVVLKEKNEKIVWFIDEADRIFGKNYRSDVFGLFRSWHTLRALDIIWNRFQLVMSYSTEARLFIPDWRQSPFNVGTKIELGDFTLEEVRHLNECHQTPLQTRKAQARLFDLVGGHPYLVRLCLYALTCQGQTLNGLAADGKKDYSLFSDHLDHLYTLIANKPELVAGLRSMLIRRTLLSPLTQPERAPQLTRMTFVLLRAAGVITGASSNSAKIR